jgi:HKD family nuclease
MNSISLVDDFFYKNGSFECAILCTYGLNLHFFENFLLKQNALYYSDNICVFTDYNIYNNFLAENYRYQPRWLNKKYLVTCLKTRGVFHSKLFIVASEKKVFIEIGSANLTRDGIASNLELVSLFEFSKNDLAHSNILRKSIDYVERLAELSKSKKAIEKVTLLKEICIPFIDNKEDKETEFIHNLDRPILDQIREFIGDNPVYNIYIISPFFDENLSPLKKLDKFFPDTHVDIHIQQAKSNFPIYQIENIKDSKDLWLFKNTDRYIHGKSIIFKSGDKNIMFCGSANFTKAALLSSANEGNFEIGLIGYISEERMTDMLSPHGQKAERLDDKTELKVEKKNEVQVEEFVGLIEFIIEAERIEKTIILSVNDEINKEFFVPLKFRLISFVGADVEIKIEEEFVISLDSKLKQKIENVDGVQIIGHDKNQNIKKSNIAWVVNLEKRRTKKNVRSRKIFNNPFELSSILEEMWKSGNIDELRKFLLSFDIPLDLILPPRRNVPTQRESRGNVEGEMPIHQYRLLFRSDSIIRVYQYFLEWMYKKLEKHKQNPQIDKFSNLMLIISTLFSFIDFIDNNIQEIYSDNDAIVADDWSIVREQYNLLFEFVDKCWGLIFRKDGYREHLNELIQRDQEQNIEDEILTFEDFIFQNGYYEQFCLLFEISKKILENFSSIMTRIKIKTMIGPLVEAKLFDRDIHLQNRKEILDFVLKNENALNNYFNQG